MFGQAFIDSVIHYGGLTLIHGTVLALLTWLLCATLLRRSRPAVQAVLWTIVLVKFMLPPILPGEMALSGWIAGAATRVSVLQVANPESSAVPIEQLTTYQRQGGPARSPEIPTSQLLFVFWLFFVVMLSGRALLALRRSNRRIRALPPADRNTEEEVAALAKWIGLKRVPEVRITDEEMTPYVFGLRRVVLVLPEKLMRVLEHSERRALILHELAHIRRKDLLIRGLQGLAGILFFFFPPVLWVCRRVEHFTEMACDRWAIAVSEVDPYEYAGALVKVVKEIRHMPQAQPGLPLVRSFRFMEARLCEVLRDDTSRSPGISARAKVTLACWSLFVLMGGSTAAVHQPISALTTTFAIKPDEVLLQERNESPPLSPQVKKLSARQKNQSRETESSQRPASPAVQDEGLTYLETLGRRSSETRTQQTLPPAIPGSLTPYEEGYLLGSRYAQEKIRRSQTERLTQRPETALVNASGQESKRSMEMRLQKLAQEPVRQ